MRGPHEVVCVICRKRFLTTHPNRKTCSPACSAELTKATRRARLSRPDVRERNRMLERLRRIENDKDPEKREARLAKIREKNHRSGRSHPKKPLFPEEHHQQVRRAASDRWYKKVYTKGRSDYMSGLITKEAISYAKIRARVDQWRTDNPERVAATRRKSCAKSELLNANGEIDAAWRSVGIFD